MTQSTTKTSRIIGLKATTVGMFQGTFFGLMGLITAISYTVAASVEFTQEAESLLRGLTFGLAQGILAIIIVPLVYFAIGWLLGSLYGVILNAPLKTSGGLVVKLANDETE